jgi:hypothetical protein
LLLQRRREAASLLTGPVLVQRPGRRRVIVHELVEIHACDGDGDLMVMAGSRVCVVSSRLQL